MTLDYIGQELIWNLRGIHPYQPNKGNYRVTIKNKTFNEYKEVVEFLSKHIEMQWLKETICEENKWNDGDSIIFKQISIRDVFGTTGIIDFFNDFNANTPIEELRRKVQQ